MEYYLAIKNEWTLNTLSNIDEFKIICYEREKPDVKVHIVMILFMWI